MTYTIIALLAALALTQLAKINRPLLMTKDGGLTALLL